jgi:hypothetical protein
MTLPDDVLIHAKRNTRDYIRSKRMNHETYDDILRRLLKIRNQPGTEKTYGKSGTTTVG